MHMWMNRGKSIRIPRPGHSLFVAYTVILIGTRGQNDVKAEKNIYPLTLQADFKALKAKSVSTMRASSILALVLITKRDRES